MTSQINKNRQKHRDLFIKFEMKPEIVYEYDVISNLIIHKPIAYGCKNLNIIISKIFIRVGGIATDYKILHFSLYV